MKVNINLKIVLLIFILGFVSMWFFVMADNYPSCATMIVWNQDMKIPKLKLWNSSKNIRWLTQNFCTMISSSKCEHDWEFFDANQSIFLSLLCDNVWLNSLFTGVIRVGEDSILLKTGFTQFGIYDYEYYYGDDYENKSDYISKVDICYYSGSDMNGCDYSQHLPKLFNPIMNDFFNIKHADLYGVDDVSDSLTSENIANAFSKKNFWWLKLCDSTNDYYEDSCDYLKGYLKNVKNLLNTTKVINIENLLKWKKKDSCGKDRVNNILYCALLWDDITPEKSFLNVVYNEYLWYRLFISYYSYELSVVPDLSELTSKDISKKMELNREKIYSFQDQMFRSRQAVSMALRSLSEVSSSFALHVGFLMYQEDAKMFMKKLSKLYPPIMTLFDKLRNVQRVK